MMSQSMNNRNLLRREIIYLLDIPMGQDLNMLSTRTMNLVAIALPSKDNLHLVEERNKTRSQLRNAELERKRNNTNW